MHSRVILMVAGALFAGAVFGYALRASLAGGDSQKSEADQSNPWEERFEERVHALAVKAGTWRPIIDSMEAGQHSEALEWIKTRAIGDYFTLRALQHQGLANLSATQSKHLKDLRQTLGKYPRFEQMKNDLPWYEDAEDSSHDGNKE
ncbi:MAG: hypothetical protein HKN13_11295 [Rhodothermales bacterium]|nr:hypothetical protein [Rhodothermales bacterium]